MHKNQLILTFVFSLFSSILCFSFQLKQINTFTQRTNEFMSAYVNDGYVDYIGIKNSNQKDLTTLIQSIADMDVSHLKPNYLKAFYINSYNLLVISKLIELYPIESPLKHSGFFDIVSYNVAGENLTLNELENIKIRAPYNDARIHFAVVCGSVGCPKLQNHAYKAKILDQQLDAVTRKSLNSDYFIRFDKKRKRVDISKVFEWYKEDFGNDDRAILAFINGFRERKIPTSSKIGKYEYDWTLNIHKK